MVRLQNDKSLDRYMYFMRFACCLLQVYRFANTKFLNSDKGDGPMSAETIPFEINVKRTAYTVQRLALFYSHICYENVVLIYIFNPRTAIYFDKQLFRHVLWSRIARKNCLVGWPRRHL
jgi:hypothetical protein